MNDRRQLAIGPTQRSHQAFDPVEREVDLARMQPDEALQDAIARAIGLDPRLGFVDALDLLARRPGLLLLDNLETPWDPPDERPKVEATLAQLAALDNVALLASFRGTDRIRGVDWAINHPVEVLAPPHDADLFCRIADWSDRDDRHLPLLLEALGGLRSFAIEDGTLRLIAENETVILARR